MPYSCYEDPARAFDAYEADRAAAAEGRTCADCRSCEEPDSGFENPEEMGWCWEFGMFVHLGDPASDCDNYAM